MYRTKKLPKQQLYYTNELEVPVVMQRKGREEREEKEKKQRGKGREGKRREKKKKSKETRIVFGAPKYLGKTGIVEIEIHI